jgi:uncharacterized protein
MGGSGLEVFNRFITSKIRPSKRLLEHTSEMIHKQQVFNLIDDQIAAYNAIMQKAKKLAAQGNKSVVIVQGGPGTGKSVIALEVMGELMRKGFVVAHATGSSAFTNTLRKILGTRVKNFLKFFNSFIDSPENQYDVLICDEAHRIRENSSTLYKKSEGRQIDELFRVAKFLIFFIDEFQIVRPNEIGSISLIKQAAVKFGVEEDDIAEFNLETQFRCSGSDAYLQWLDNALDIRPAEFAKFDTKMHFEILDSPKELQKIIHEKNELNKNSSRIVAGFCWPWSAPEPDGSLIDDVVVGDLKMPWEPKDKFWQWATFDSGMNQVGTVYTAQGFEFDYVGVIFGEDLVIRDGKWVAQPGKSFDTMAKRNNSEFLKHLKNIYRVLFSRAHKGVYVYFIDKETEEYFKDQLARK